MPRRRRTVVESMVMQLRMFNAMLAVKAGVAVPELGVVAGDPWREVKKHLRAWVLLRMATATPDELEALRRMPSLAGVTDAIDSALGLTLSERAPSSEGGR